MAERVTVHVYLNGHALAWEMAAALRAYGYDVKPKPDRNPFPRFRLFGRR